MVHEFQFDETIIEELQKYAEENKSIEEMLDYLINALSLGSHSRLIVMVYLREAFSISIKDVSLVGAWEFFDGGSWKIEDVEKEMMPHIKTYLNTRGT